MLKKKKNNKGFTLVELLVVIAIIGILAVVAVPALFKNIEKSKAASLESDISAIKSATLSWVTEKNTLTEASVIGKEAIITALEGELESIKDPFNASSYIINSDASTGDIMLTINFANSISENISSKLNKDLANEAANKLGGNEDDKENKSVVSKDRTNLKVVLMKAQGLPVKGSANAGNN